jgi:hypothetical protein
MKMPSDVRRSARAASLLLGLVVLAHAATVEAVPAFARKYQTSCQTCHIVFPKLNAFGEAFRLNGYRMPKETEEMIKEKPVSLGAPAYKKLWPKAIWPGAIPSAVPLAVNIKFADINTSTLNDDGTVTSVKNDLQFPQELNIFGAGTLGDHVSYLSEVTFGENPDSSVSVELEHAHLSFDSPWGPENLLHIRLGKLAPNLVDGFQEMWLMTDAGIDSLFAYDPIGQAAGATGLVSDSANPVPISLPALVRGIEGYGIIKHRVLWVAGLANGISANGRFDGNNAKDYYARLDYKFGGMGLDGDTTGKEVPEKNWRDDSVRIGTFVYRGDGGGIDFPTTLDTGPANIQDQHFLRVGFYASAFYKDLNVFGAFVRGTDTLQLFDPDTNAFTGGMVQPHYRAWFTEADYVIYPWLHAAFRYETVRQGDRTVPGFGGIQTSPSLRTGVFNISALIRANVKGMLEYQRDLREGQNHSLNALVRFAF